jgi:DNA helicase-2/ATP-dependent DNA helicase PcrA
VAGPGSGKTLVLTCRVARLLGEGLVTPERMLIVTFTKKAAEEMSSRVAKLLNRSTDLPWLGTLHSRFLRILRAEYGNDLTILSENEDRRWISMIQKQESLELSRDLTEKDILKMIDTWRLSCKSPQAALEQHEALLRSHQLDHLLSLPLRPMPHQILDETESRVAMSRQVLEIYKVYQRMKREKNAVDFTDMIYETWRLLATSDQIRAKWSKHFEFILVDEFQDVDLCQYQIIKMLAGEKRNLFVVGDDDQAIYGFRGAKPELMIDMDKDYQGLTTIVLLENFRCPSNIVSTANKAIAVNEKRIQKEFVGIKDPVAPVFSTVSDTDESGTFVVETIKELVANKTPLNEIVVVYRVHACSLPFEVRLMDADIPYIVRKGGCFYDLPEVVDFLAYFQIAVNRYLPDSVQRVANKPLRMAKKDDISGWRKQSGKVEDLGRVEASYALPLMKLGNDLISLQQICRDTPSEEVLGEIFNYEFWTPEKPQTYAEFASAARMEDGSPDSDIQAAMRTLQHSAGSYEDPASFLAHVDRTRSYAKAKRDSENAILLSTFHGVKGLEFDHVFLTGMSEGCMPHKKSLTDPRQLQEERRLAHVGWTRTKNRVYVVTPISEGLPSRFVAEWNGSRSTPTKSSSISSRNAG